MIERVQLNMERMISELEDYKSRGIFSSRELKKIIETRRKHEFRLQRSEKKLLDFIRYIKSECLLERIRDKRVKEKNVTPSKYDVNISNKIIELYKNAMYRFNDPKIIVQFTSYVTKRKMYEDMKDVLAECCSRNPLDVDLWIYCALKLFDIGDVESSRALFLKGIRVNSKSEKIRIEFFRMEVMYAEKLEALNKEMGLDEEDRDDIEKGDLAFTVFLDYFTTSSMNRDDLNEILQISERIHELKQKIEEYINNDPK